MWDLVALKEEIATENALVVIEMQQKAGAVKR